MDKDMHVNEYLQPPCLFAWKAAYRCRFLLQGWEDVLRLNNGNNGCFPETKQQIEYLILGLSRIWTIHLPECNPGVGKKWLCPIVSFYTQNTQSKAYCDINWKPRFCTILLSLKFFGFKTVNISTNCGVTAGAEAAPIKLDFLWEQFHLKSVEYIQLIFTDAILRGENGTIYPYNSIQICYKQHIWYETLPL